MKLSICISLACLSFIAGVVVMGNHSVQNIKANKVEGYHCTPITTHTSLESAKAQVRVYQAKVATVHGIGVK